MRARADELEELIADAEDLEALYALTISDEDDDAPMSDWPIAPDAGE